MAFTHEFCYSVVQWHTYTSKQYVHSNKRTTKTTRTMLFYSFSGWYSNYWL